jgi:hypothetical protein
METTAQPPVATMTPAMRYYLLNREEKMRKMSERYHNRPDVIAKREERERLRAEKEAAKALEKEAKKAARVQRMGMDLSERIELAKKTSRVAKKYVQAADPPLENQE